MIADLLAWVTILGFVMALFLLWDWFLYDRRNRRNRT